MPTLISRGAASAKAFGLTNGSLTLTTTTFTSSGTWVAPAGVALVLVLSGRGQDGSPYALDSIIQYFTSNWPGPGLANPPYASWSNIWTDILGTRGEFLTRIGTYGPAGIVTSQRTYVGTDSSWTIETNTDSFTSVIINSVTFPYVYAGNPQTTGDIFAGVGYNAWAITVNYTVPGFLGASSTALGQTFPGGNGGPASVTTFNNIAVTPGTSYPIVVAPGGYVTIQYLAP